MYCIFLSVWITEIWFFTYVWARAWQAFAVRFWCVSGAVFKALKIFWLHTLRLTELKRLYLCWLPKCLDSGYTANPEHKTFCLFTLSFLLLLLFRMCFLVGLAPFFCLPYRLICAVSMAIFRLMIKVLASVRGPSGFCYFSTGSPAYPRPRPLHGASCWLAAFGRCHNNVIECRHCDKVELPGT